MWSLIVKDKMDFSSAFICFSENKKTLESFVKAREWIPVEYIAKINRISSAKWFDMNLEQNLLPVEINL